MVFRMRFYSNLVYMGLYSSWGSIYWNAIYWNAKFNQNTIIVTNWISRYLNCDEFHSFGNKYLVIILQKSLQYYEHMYCFFFCFFISRVRFYSRWGCIFSYLVFDWGSINISNGWGCIQEWGSINADTVFAIKFGNFSFSLAKQRHMNFLDPWGTPGEPPQGGGLKGV